MNSSSRGGRREGAGRPKVDVKRKHRALQFFDEEWELIRSRADARGMVPREYLYALAERDTAGAGVNKLPDLAADGVSVTFCLKKDLADRLPKDRAELRGFLVRCVNYGLEGFVPEWLSRAGKIGGSAKSAAKAASSRENGKKGGRPKKSANPAR